MTITNTTRVAVNAIVEHLAREIYIYEPPDSGLAWWEQELLDSDDPAHGVLEQYRGKARTAIISQIGDGVFPDPAGDIHVTRVPRPVGTIRSGLIRAVPDPPSASDGTCTRYWCFGCQQMWTRRNVDGPALNDACGHSLDLYRPVRVCAHCAGDIAHDPAQAQFVHVRAFGDNVQRCEIPGFIRRAEPL